jgi:hypothetical protein
LNNNRGNNNNNRRRGRGNNNGGGRPQGGGNQQVNRIDSRARGNALQLLEKYRKLAHDAHLNGDRVTAEYYLQFADHYFRVIADTRLRQEEARARRDDRWQDNGEPAREEADDSAEFRWRATSPPSISRPSTPAASVRTVLKDRVLTTAAGASRVVARISRAARRLLVAKPSRSLLARRMAMSLRLPKRSR